MTQDLRNLTIQGSIVQRHQLPSPFVTETLFQAAKNAANLLIDGITEGNITSLGVKQLMIQLIAPFPRLQLHDYSTHRPSENAFCELLSLRKDHVMYIVTLQYIRKQNVGEVMATQTIYQRLNAIKQRRYDQEKRTLMIESIAGLHTAFLRIIQEINNDPTIANAELPELDRIFYNALIPELHGITELARMVDHPPSRNVPEKIDRLNALVKESKQREESNRLISDVAFKASKTLMKQQTRATPLRGMESSTFVSSAESPNAFTATEHYEKTYESTPSFPPIPQFQLKDEVYSFAINMLSESAEAMQSCHMSSAERALIKASGKRAPIECWGCKGLYDDCLHSFKMCPRRQEQQVRDNFYKNLKKWRENKERVTEYDANQYKKLGFAEIRSVMLFNHIADQRHTPEVRRQFINEFLMLEQSRLNDDRDPSPPSMKPPKRRKTPNNVDKQGYSFMIYPLLPTTSFNGIYDETNFTGLVSGETEPEIFTNTKITVDNIVYPMSSSMLYMKLPVGRNEDAKFTLEGLADTGGCSNLAHLPYMKAIVEEFPDISNRFCCLAEHKMEDIRIGGIGGKIKITHFVELWMPYRLEGANTRIVFGLSDDLPITTIFGVPFFVSTQSSIHLGKQRVHSDLLQCHWPLYFTKPHRKPVESVPRYHDAAGVSFLLSEGNNSSQE